MKLGCIRRCVIRFISSIIYPVKIYGKENLPDGGSLIVSNHLSVIDCVYLVRANVKENYSILAKKELFRKKIIAKTLKSFGAVPIDRDKPDVNSLLTVVRNLKNDEKVILFPEGTRNKVDANKLQPLKEGVVFFALKAKKPIVPVMIYKKAKLFCRNKIIIGKPFELSEYYGKKYTDDDMKKMECIVYDKMTEQYNLLKSKGRKD